MKLSEFENALTRFLNEHELVDHEMDDIFQISQYLAYYIEKLGMLPPKALIKKESEGIQWEVEAHEWEPEE